MVSTAETPSRSMAFNQILRLLEDLNDSSRGKAIYQHIAETFDHIDACRFENEGQYIEVLELLFELLSEHIDEDSPLQTEIYILKSAFVAPLPSDELARLKLKTQALMQRLTQLDIQQKPSLNQPGTRQDASPTLEPEPENTSANPPPQKPAQEEQTAPVSLSERTAQGLPPVKEALEQQVDAATQCNNELAKLLRESMEAVRQIESKEHANEIRLDFMRRYVHLFKEHQKLSTRFDDIRARLDDIETRDAPSDNISASGSASDMSDDITPLPGQVVLAQRLNDEVARIQRYGGALALAILDMDDFELITDNFGSDVGNTVQKRFADIVLSVFRHHDTVTQYDGGTFAILMPSTELEGALCALKKTQVKIGNSSCHIDGDQELKLPTFSAGLALYSNGEAADNLVARAETAMKRAKQSGKNRIEVHTQETGNTTSTPNTFPPALSPVG